MLNNVITVEEFKAKIGETKGLDSENLTLTYRNKKLKNEQILTSVY